MKTHTAEFAQGELATGGGGSPADAEASSEQATTASVNNAAHTLSVALADRQTPIKTAPAEATGYTDDDDDDDDCNCNCDNDDEDEDSPVSSGRRCSRCHHDGLL